MSKYEYSFFSSVKGVSFQNSNGTDRQKNIKKYVKIGRELFIQGYMYDGNLALALLGVDGDMKTQIGNLSSDIVSNIERANIDTEF